MENPEPCFCKQCEVPSCKFKSGVFGPKHIRRGRQQRKRLSPPRSPPAALITEPTMASTASAHSTASTDRPTDLRGLSPRAGIRSGMPRHAQAAVASYPSDSRLDWSQGLCHLFCVVEYRKYSVQGKVSYWTKIQVRRVILSKS